MNTKLERGLYTECIYRVYIYVYVYIHENFKLTNFKEMTNTTKNQKAE